MSVEPSTKWVQRYLALAVEVASWSRDPSTQVGAVLVDERKRVVGVGYNGFPDRVPDDDILLKDREAKLSLTIHAEVNAVLNCPVPTRGLTLFITHPPCGDCAKFIVQAGITRVYYLQPEDQFLDRWRISMDRAKAVFDLAGMSAWAVQRVASR